MRGVRLLLWLPLFLTLTACPPAGKDSDDTGSEADADTDVDSDTDTDTDTDTDDPCQRLIPDPDPAVNSAQIEACLLNGSARLLEGLFHVSNMLEIPQGAVLGGAGKDLTIIRLTAEAETLLKIGGDTHVHDLALDLAGLVQAGCCASALQIQGSNNLVERTWLGSTIPSLEAHDIGVYWLSETGSDNVVRESEISGTFYGAIFRSGMLVEAGNRLENSEIHDTRCDGVTFVGYGEAVDNEIFHVGWDCENGPIPGAAVYSLNNGDGALLSGNEIYDTCGHGVDLDGGDNFIIDGNTVYNPGYTWNGLYGWCGGAQAALALIDVSNSSITGNSFLNEGRPANSIIGDSNHVFSSASGSLASDLPAASSTVIAAWLTQRPSSLGEAVSNVFEDNVMRASCSPPCLGVGYFTSRGTGMDAGGGWSASTTNYFRGNNPIGSNHGSKRCGGNWYAGDSDCPQNSTDSECNFDDYQHDFDSLRNDNCRNY